MIGDSPLMGALRARIARLGSTSHPVLIRGETGTGKELVARALHALGEGPFIAVNCAALAPNVIESELFGHERGAFTGAERRKPGCFEQAGHGTLFLDEIGALPLALQAKLLRVLEDKTFRRVGGEQELRFHGRVVAATCEELDPARFRDDLYYRLSVAELSVPSLGERREDIPALVAAFAGRKLAFTDEAMLWLTERDWPGNVRELKNVIERLVLYAAEDIITVRILQDLARPRPRAGSIEALAAAVLRLPDGNKLDLIQRIMVQRALEESGGNKSRAARLLGVERKIVDRRLTRSATAPRAGRDRADR